MSRATHSSRCARVVKSSLALLLLTALLHSDNGVQASQATALDEYVHAPDPNYSWEHVDTFSEINRAWTAYTLRLVSQRWGVGIVIPEHEIWTHYLTIVIPRNLTSTDLATLYMTGGNRNSGMPGRLDTDIIIVTTLATEINQPVAALFQTPCQPFIYLDDPEQRSRSEDNFIAYGWRIFLEGPNPDPYVLARLPMTKAGARAMDAVEEFLAEEFSWQIDRWVVSGASKRGWTAWTLAAVDSRVVAAIPLVMDDLNFVENIRHHHQMLDGWSFALGSYYDQNLTANLENPRLDDMMAVVDPYSYRDRYTFPIYMISATGDQFFMPDDSTYFSADIGEHFTMQSMPNCEHSLVLCIFKVVYSIAGFVDTITHPEVTQQPVFTSFISEADGTITFLTETPPKSVRVWSALSAADTGRKDFRLMALDDDGEVVPQAVLWTSEDLAPDVAGTYVARVDVVLGRWVAFFIEAEYEGRPGGRSQRYTSEVSIVPRNFPVPPCVGQGCFGTLK